MNHPAVPEPELQLGKYHIVRPLKVGGTAAIYLAVLRGENNFSREVVIKRPLPHLVADGRARLMFIDEAHIASRLSHPNICQVLDLVAREDELYLVLEYLKGLDLREVLKRCMELGRLIPPEVAVWIGIEVCAGLHFAHESVAIDGSSLSLIHRDVSPKNIRITHSGSVKVIDFGIARAASRATETAVGTIKGTLGYMSPEQIMGDTIDRRSDIFAFGICLFQMLTCKNPFDGSSLKERVRKLTQAPVPSVCEFNGALDPEIEHIVDKCLKRDVDERYQRLSDVQIDLDHYLARLQTSSPRQKLIQFLEEIFPGLHDTDPELKLALTEISTVAGRIDTSQRLRFPDDEGVRPMSIATRSTVKQDSTLSTIRDAAYQSTRTASAASVPSMAQPGGDQTAKLAPADPTAELVRETSAEGSTGVQAPPSSWRALAVALAMVLAAVAGAIAYLKIDGVTSQPLDPDPPPLAAVVVPAPENKELLAATNPTPLEKTVERIEPNNVEKTKKSVRPIQPAFADRDRALLYFRTGNRLERAGRTDEALLLYTLAYDKSGRRVDPSIYKNLGLLHNRSNEIAKARACFRGYLDKNPGAPDADRVRTMIASFPPTKSVQCVDGEELARARRTAERKGAMIDSWVSETLEERLR